VSKCERLVRGSVVSDDIVQCGYASAFTQSMLRFSKTLSSPFDQVPRWRQFGRIQIVSSALVLTVATSGACSVPTKIGGSMRSESSLERDRSAIEALNQHDVTAALASDVEAIVSQWTDDFVVIPPAGPIVRGRFANAAVPARALTGRRCAIAGTPDSGDWRELLRRQTPPSTQMLSTLIGWG
jgi:hypothetical protein